MRVCEICGEFLADPSDDGFKDRIGKFGHKSPSTSRKAAVAVYPKSGSQRHRLILLIAQSESRGLTCDEAEKVTGLPHQSASARWNELWHDFEFIEPNGKERPTRAGASALAFVLTAKGAQAMRDHGDLW